MYKTPSSVELLSSQDSVVVMGNNREKSPQTRGVVGSPLCGIDPSHNALYNVYSSITVERVVGTLTLLVCVCVCVFASVITTYFIV